MESKRLNLILDTPTHASLEDMKVRRGLTYTTAVRRAVGLLQYVLNSRDEGLRVCVVDHKDKILKDLHIY